MVQVYNQLIGPEHRVARGSIGIMFDAVENPAITRVYGNGSGVTISSVVPGSPADQAGLKVGDTITTVDGKKVTEIDAVIRALAKKHAGDVLDLTVFRAGSSLDLKVKLTDAADDQV